MLISIDMLVDYFPTTWKIQTLSRKSDENGYLRRLTIGSNNLYNAGTLYIIDSNELHINHPGLQHENALLICGKPNLSFQPLGYDILYTEDAMSVPEIFTYLQKIFYMLQEWASELKDLLLQRKSLQELLITGYRLLENEIAIQAPTYHFLYYTPNCTSVSGWEYDEKTGAYVCDRDTLDQLLCDSKFVDLNKQKGFFVYKDPLEKRSIITNYYLDDRYVARLIIVDGVRSFTAGYLQICKYFIKIIDQAIHSYALTDTFADDRTLQKTVHQLLSSVHFSRQLLRDNLQTFAWEVHDQYLCITMRLIHSTFSENDLEYFFMRIRKNLGFGNNIVIYFQGVLVLIVNLTLSKETKKDYLSRFSVFIRENLIHAGISNIFTDFEDLYYAYQQALIALNHKQHTPESTNWCQEFQHCALDYLISESCQTLPVKFLIPNKLQNLLEHDQKSDVSYIDTLHIFLQKRNSVQAAKELNISRTAFNERIDKIVQITGIDFKNSDECLYYSWALKLLQFHPEND